jgi:hypothetical protein
VGGFLILIGVAGLVIGGIATANSAIRALRIGRRALRQVVRAASTDEVRPVEEVGSLARAYARFAPNFGPELVGNGAIRPLTASLLSVICLGIMPASGDYPA